MATVLSDMKKTYPLGALFLELALVVLAFFLMVISSCFYVNNMLRNHLRKDARNMLTQTKLEIESELAEPQAALTVVSNTIRRIILQGGSAEAVHAYIRETAEEMRGKPFGSGYDIVFGYFEAFDGAFLHSAGWRGADNYDPTSRPWYKTAVEAGDNTAVTPMYMNVHSNDYLVTFVRRIFDEENRPLGVVCLDVRLDHIREGAVNMKITPGGYGILLNENQDIVAYPGGGLTGKNANEVSGNFPLLKQDLESGNDVSEREFISLRGEEEIFFSASLENGWILFISTPTAEYYRELRDLRLIISVLGAVLAGVLMFILINVERSKNKSEEQSRKKSALLAEMEKMREADERTHVMLDTAPLGVNIWDSGLNLIDCNEETVRLFEITGKQEYLDRFNDLSPEYQPCGKLSAEMAVDLLRETMEKGYCRTEWMHQKLSGELLPTEVIMVRVRHREEYVITVYIRDLREFKAMLAEVQKAGDDLRAARDIAEESNKAKSRFLATMSHEIRTPMNVILGVTESRLQTENNSREVRHAFEQIYNSADLLMHIINDILDLSKIEAGKFELSPARYEVASLINDAAHLNVSKFEHKPIEFNLRVDENIPARLFGDELRLKQILNNLLSNALKYTDSGEVTLTFAAGDTEPKDDDRVMLIFTVKDTGQGMTAEQVEKLFDEYSRFNLDANRTTVGTGLGMTITRNLVKMMNGEISVDSTPGAGSTFIVRVPQGRTSVGLLGRETARNFERFHFTSLAQKKNKKITRDPMPYGKVLIVDDMKSNLDVAKLLLNPYKLAVDTAESGFSAIDLVKNGAVYDIIFMDHMMPKMDGIEAVKNIRELGYKNTIIALTANAITGQKAIFLSKGFDAYISKPIDIRQLDDILNKFIRDKRPPEEIASARKQNGEAAGTGTKPARGAEEKITIPGVDTDIGLVNCDRDIDMYISVLRSFVPNAREITGKMRLLSRETLEDYVISVHGLKGISGTIGAKQIWEAALNLETFAKAGNFNEVLGSNGALVSATETIAANIETCLAERDSRNPKPHLPFPDREILARLQHCCEAYDMDGIDEAMEELENSVYEKDASLVAGLRETIDDLDFPLAAERIAAYLKERT